MQRRRWHRESLIFLCLSFAVHATPRLSFVCLLCAFALCSYCTQRIRPYSCSPVAWVNDPDRKKSPLSLFLLHSLAAAAAAAAICPSFPPRRTTTTILRPQNDDASSCSVASRGEWNRRQLRPRHCFLSRISEHRRYYTVVLLTGQNGREASW